MSFFSLLSSADGIDRNRAVIVLLIIQIVFIQIAGVERSYGDELQLPAKDSVSVPHVALDAAPRVISGFAPIVVIAPGAIYDGGDNEVHWVGSRLLYERATGWKLPVIQLLQHQNIEELLELLVKGGFTHILLSRTLLDKVDHSMLGRWSEVYWISVGTQLDVSELTEEGLNFQQWRPDYPIYQYLFLLSIFANRTLNSEEVPHDGGNLFDSGVLGITTGNESEISSMGQWIWHIHPRFERLMHFKDRLECFAEAFAANHEVRVKTLWEESPHLAAWGVRFPKGFAIANLQYQDLKTEKLLVNVSIFTRYDTLAYQALLHAKEAPVVSGDYPVSASSGSMLLLNDSKILSPYFEGFDLDDVSAKVYENTLNSCIPVK